MPKSLSTVPISAGFWLCLWTKGTGYKKKIVSL
jgi:hypothetical protein